MALIIFLAVSLLLHGALGELVCEQLPVELCSYSVASFGKRCLLETFATEEDREVIYQCKTSEVVVDVIQERIESDECVNACGLDRNTVGISSDTLFEPHLLAKLCSSDSYQSCPNIIDLYFNLALGEGIYLPDICANPRHALSTTRSSSDANSNPIFVEVTAAFALVSSHVGLACAPTTI
ncbi:uncharacterized protein LOC8279793 [Ricinus communis]|uniref:NtEIG-E80 protein n=1 Tax=Ricinus communis TaxID=3988 RepID=B9S384_RICCO|nr:uncharacterized protein LOC8279793 [Ricinus communis]EEF41866.1 conserved hypothetical protein [Ricinus communis]|eukprot:XP_002520453.1 uncharacterized protein LOC8279793 [Ricinus communis]